MNYQPLLLPYGGDYLVVVNSIFSPSWNDSPKLTRAHSAPVLFLSSEMKSSLSWSVIPSVEQSPTPHSAPRRQYLSWICLSFLQIHLWIQCKSVAT
jgi:hypothetical protein